MKYSKSIKILSIIVCFAILLLNIQTEAFALRTPATHNAVSLLAHSETPEAELKSTPSKESDKEPPTVKKLQSKEKTTGLGLITRGRLLIGVVIIVAIMIATTLLFRHHKDSESIPYPPEVVVSLLGNNPAIIEDKNNDVNVGADEDDARYKAISWRWSKENNQWTTKKWGNGSSALNLSDHDLDDLVFRFVISGTAGTEYVVIFEDRDGNKIEINSSEYIYVKDGAKQYALIRLDELAERAPGLRWSKLKPIRFKIISPGEGGLYIQEPRILDVEETRESGVGIGMFAGGIDVETIDPEEDDGNEFPKLTSLDRRMSASEPSNHPPVSVCSFTNIKDDISENGTVERWKELAEDGVVPHEVLEFNELGPDILRRINEGEFDDKLQERAKAIGEYGGPLLERMLHEPAGGWYPWSVRNKEDADNYVKAWKRMVRIYQEAGLTNVRFVFSPHNYEPNNLAQSSKYQLMDYILWHIQDDVDLVGIDAYSYPPSGGYFNELATGMIQKLKKYNIPFIAGEMSSAMSEEDKHKFWEYLIKDLEDGMFIDLRAITIFSIRKHENNQWLDFRPPVDIVKEFQKNPFFRVNPFPELFALRQNRKNPTGINEPILPDSEPIKENKSNQPTVIGRWAWTGDGNTQLFTEPTSRTEKWIWSLANIQAYWGADEIGIKSIKKRELKNFTLAIPINGLSGDFEIMLEDGEQVTRVGDQWVGHELVVPVSSLKRYIRDNVLYVPLDKLESLLSPEGKKTLKKFNWQNIRQVKFHPLSREGSVVLGRPQIIRIDNRRSSAPGTIRQKPFDSRKSAPTTVLPALTAGSLLTAAIPTPQRAEAALSDA